MQISVEKNGSLKRRLTVTIPGERIEQEVSRRLEGVRKNAKIKGFRPGKAPPGVVRRQYGTAVREDVLSELMQSHYAEAVRDQSLAPIAAPQLHPGETDADGSYTFTAELEVYPEFEVKDIVGVTLTRPQVEITESDVETVIERLRGQHVSWQVVERPAAEGDQVIIDFQGRIDGEPFAGNSATDMPLVLGSRSVLPEFESGLLGVRAGETRTLDLRFPEDYAKPELAGQTARFEVHVKRVEESRLPELDEEFAARFGITEGGAERLREKVRENMQNELDERVREELEKQAADALLAANPIEVPQALVESEILRQQRATMRRLGIELAPDSKPELPREPFVAQAERRVRLGLVLSRLIEREQFAPDPARVERKIEAFASESEDPVAQARAMRADNEVMRQIESLVLEEIAYEWLIEQAAKRDDTRSFFDFMEPPQADRAGEDA